MNKIILLSAVALTVALVGFSAAAALVNHFEFNDAGNGGLNLLNATVGANAEVKTGKTTVSVVSGIGNLTAVSGEGRTDGVGAIRIPSGQFLSFAQAVGTDTMRPWCLVMRVRDPDATRQNVFKAFYSLNQNNSTDGELFRNDENSALGRSRYWFRYPDGANSYCGDFSSSDWHTIVISFYGANEEPGSYCYLDDLTTPLLQRKSTVDKYPSQFAQDSLQGKAYVYIAADDDGEDQPLEFDDIKLYNEARPSEVFDNPPLVDQVKTAPWQQNVYTNCFTIMCETKSVVDGLRLEYGTDYAQTVPMSYVQSNGGTYLYKASVQIDGQAGATIPYRLGLASDTIPVDYAATVTLWSGDPEESFKCSIWGDNQTGAKNGDWDADKFQYLTSVYRHMLSRGVDFGITSGDMSGDAAYSSQISPCLLQRANGIFGKEKPYYVARGNHDDLYGNNPNIMPYFDFPSGNNGYYLYRGNVLFVFVHWSAYAVAANLDATKTWLAGILATPEAQAAKFRILVQHAPMYLEVWGDNNEDGLLQTAVSGGIDVVFSGHMHGYERIERGGIVQLTNGGLGYLDHTEHVVNNYGTDTKVGGHLDTPYLWARQSSNGVLGTPSPVHMGCITSYGELKVSGDKLTYLAHGFNADGSYIGVFDTFELTSKSVSAQAFAPVALASCANPADFAAVTNAPCTKALWAQYKSAIGETYEYTGSGSDPVTGVSRDEVEAFCAWLNGDRTEDLYRIPYAYELIPTSAVSLWTSSTTNNGWVATVGTATVYGTDVSAIATPGCSANYLGFRLVVGEPARPNVWVTEPSLPKLEMLADDDITVDLGVATDGTPVIAVDGVAVAGSVIHAAALEPGRHTLTVTVPKHSGWTELTKSIDFVVEPDTLVNYYTFDDADDILKATVGADAQIFQGRNSVAPITGLGVCTVVSGEGRTDNTGALCIPRISDNSQFLAISHGVPKTGGHPWCMVIKCYAPTMATGYLTFYSLDQNNNDDGYLFCKKGSSYRLGSSKWSREYSPDAVFTENTWHTLVISCDGRKTRLWLDNAEQKASNAGFGNYRPAERDLLDGKDYIYISGDDDGDDGTMYIDSVKIYAESAPPSVFKSSFREYFFDDATAWSWAPVAEDKVSADEVRWTFTESGRLTPVRTAYGIRIETLDELGNPVSTNVYGCASAGEDVDVPDPGEGSAVVTVNFAAPTIAYDGASSSRRIPLSFSNIGSGLLLVAAYGDEDGGADFSDWPYTRVVKALDAGETSYVCDTTGWDHAGYVRFYLVDQKGFPVSALECVGSLEQKAMGVCTRYLDARCPATKNTEISCQVKLSNISAQSRIFVCNNIDSTMRVEMYINGNGYPAESCCGISSWSTANGVSKGLTTSTSYKVKTTDIATWTLNVYGKVASYKNGAGTVSQSGNTYFQPGELVSSTVWFLGIPTAWTNMYAANGRLYSAYIKESGVFVRNFIPATGYRNTGALVPGMFDTVEGKFYPSAGTEEFTAGDARSTPYAPSELGNISFLSSTPARKLTPAGLIFILR